MAVAYKVVFDAVDPHSQAFFWADVLGYVVEDNAAFIRSLLDAGAITDAEVTEFDGRLFFSSGAAARDPYSPVDERGVGLGGRVLFLAVPEHKTSKNRVHLDVHVGAGECQPRRSHSTRRALSRIGGDRALSSRRAGARVTSRSPTRKATSSA